MLCQSDKEPKLANHQPILYMTWQRTDGNLNWGTQGKWIPEDNFLSSSFYLSAGNSYGSATLDSDTVDSEYELESPFTSGYPTKDNETSTHIGKFTVFLWHCHCGSRSDYNLSLRSSFTSSSFLGCHPGPNESKAQDALECTTKPYKAEA
jgi:hypothetical protein